MRVLVTGATGYIGSRLLDELAATHEVVAFGRSSRPEGVEFVRGDLTCRADVVRAVSGCAAVIHLGARLEPAGSGMPSPPECGMPDAGSVPCTAPQEGEAARPPDPDARSGESDRQIMAVNVVGTYHVAVSAALSGAARLVLASSIAAVGARHDVLPIDEEALPRPEGIYGLSKRLSELVCARAAPRFAGGATALRIGVVHPLHPVHVPASPGDCTRWFAGVHVDDVVSLLIRALEVPLPGFTIFNATAANPVSRYSMERARRVLGVVPVHDFAAVVPPALRRGATRLAMFLDPRRLAGRLRRLAAPSRD